MQQEKKRGEGEEEKPKFQVQDAPANAMGAGGTGIKEDGSCATKHAKEPNITEEAATACEKDVFPFPGGGSENRVTTEPGSFKTKASEWLHPTRMWQGL